MIKVPSVFTPSKIVKKFGLCLALTAGLLASTQMSSAEWREEIGVFRIGISSIDEKPIRPEKLEPFRVAISATLKMPVEIFLAKDAAALMDAMASSRIEYAVMSAIGYATLDKSCECVEPLVAPIGSSGDNAMRSVLVVNADKVTSIVDLPGKKLAIGPTYSVAAHMLPMTHFTIGGFTFEKARVELAQAEDLESAIQMVRSQQVDGFFGWDKVVMGTDKIVSAPYDRLFDDGATAFMTLWHSEPLRYGPHIVHQSVPSDAKALLREVLPKLHEIAPIAFDAISPTLSGSLVSVKREDYRMARKLVEALHSDTTGSVD